MRNKLVELDAAIRLIDSGDVVAVSGFGTNGVPEYLIRGLAERFQADGAPAGLTLLFGGGPGDGGERGLNQVADPGLVRRAIGGHWGLVPRLAELAVSGQIEAWNVPLGVISHQFRDMAQGLPGTLTRIGLGTYADPDLEGCRINDCSTEALVERVGVGGETLLFYRATLPRVALLRGTTADPAGNVTLERESLTQDVRAMAMATRNAGGLVIVQVERVAAEGSLDPRQVVIPGILVDCVVVSPAEHHMQTFGCAYDPAFSAELRRPLAAIEPMALDGRKLIARRAALELIPNAVINLGIGMPEGVASVAHEERVLDYLTLTAEPGLIGGIPQGGLDFGSAVNAGAVIDMNQQFDLYDGGGLDLAFLGLAQADGAGNVNVSRFGKRLAGSGGFVNITQSTRRLVYMGTFTAGGLEVAIEDGALRILREGRVRKFLDAVEQVTFSGKRALETGQTVLFVTERCVLGLEAGGLRLLEVAPGVEIGRDILAHMAFEPLMDTPPALMDRALFLPEPLDLSARILELPLADRIRYDAQANLLFLNFEALRIDTLHDVGQVRAAVTEVCEKLDRRVDVVVNYDSFSIPEACLDAWATMAAELEAAYYSRVSRYTTSAFLRMKLGERLTARGMAPHLFEAAGGPASPWENNLGE